MVETDVFEARLADALRAYASEAPLEVDAVELTSAIAARGTQRSRWSVALGPLRRRQMVLLVLGALLILATLVAIASVGAWLTRDDRLVVDRDHPLPNELYGEWIAIPAGGADASGNTYLMDFATHSLIRDPDGTTADWAGRAVAFTPIGARAWEVVVRSPGPCGEGRYTVREVPARLDLDPALKPAIDTIALTGADDACAARVAILEGAFAWTRHDPIPQPLVPGTTYGSASFSEPFHFVMPSTDPVGSMRKWGTVGGLRIFAGCCWSTWFVDDQPVNVDVCDYTKGRLDDVPSTPEAVEAWLRSSSRLTVSHAIEIPVDGRTALRFDLKPAEDCRSREGTLTQPSFDIGFRIYAIPTGDDMILYSVWSDPGSLPSLDMGVEELVRSMTFD